MEGTCGTYIFRSQHPEQPDFEGPRVCEAYDSWPSNQTLSASRCEWRTHPTCHSTTKRSSGRSTRQTCVLCRTLLPDTPLRAAHISTSLEPSSMGWDVEEKKETLFDEDSRFVLIYRRRSTDDPESTLVAFCMFRFEFGYEEDDTIYWYEQRC